jgi:hypothetical protein
MFTALMAVLVSVGFGLTVPAQKGQKGKPTTAAAAKSVEAAFAVSPAANVERHKFTIGEKLVYTVKANLPALGLDNSTVARFSTEVVERGDLHGREGYRLLVKAETVGATRFLFELNDRFTTFLDAKSRLPYRAEYDIKQGPEERNSLVTFDQTKRQVQYGDKQTATLKGDTYDAAGLLWATRNLDFNDDKVARLTCFDDRNGRLIPIEIERLGVEKLTIAGREVEAVQFALRLADNSGKVNDDKKIRLWFTNDAKRYAVLITASPGFGDVRAELTRFPSE